MKRVLTIWSHTHYGRGTPIVGEEVRKRIRVAQAVLDLIIPDKSIYGYCDEDYGWICPLTTAEQAEILARYPESLIESTYAYLHDNKAASGDEIEIEVGTDKHTRLVCIEDMSEEHRRQITGKQPVGRDFESLFHDWFDCYGCH